MATEKQINDAYSAEVWAIQNNPSLSATQRSQLITESDARRRRNIAAIAAQQPGVAPPQKATAEMTVVEAEAGTAKLNEDVNFGRQTKLDLVKFPEDLGSISKIPYMLIKIFRTQTGAIPTEQGYTDITTQSLVNGTGAAVDIVSGLPGAQAVANTAGEIADAFAKKVGYQGSITSRAKDLIKSFNLKRNVAQLEQAIALFMPDGITTNYDNEYQALSITSTLGLGGFAAQALAAGVKGESQQSINSYIVEAASAYAGRLLGSEDFVKLGLFATTGQVINPQMEMIYSSPVLRKFIFDFRLIPRNASESEQIKKIIKMLKKESAPEIPANSTGRYLIPPAQFEIEFYDGNDALNNNFFRTKKCVLTSISLDYTPNGFATFKDGAPVETRMQLQFQETVIMDKQAIEEGY